MKHDRLIKAVMLAQKGAHLFIATGVSDDYPHLAPASRLQLSPDEERITVEAWFCPGTIENLKRNEKLDLVVWDAILDEGYQLLGKCQGAEDIAFLNGYDASLPEKPGLPQVEKRIGIRVEKVLPFHRGSHTDQEDS